MFQNYKMLSEAHLDVMKEIGNIGAGNAATALATMLNESVKIGLPKVRIAGFDETVEALGGATTVSVGVLVNFFGDVHGMMMFLINFQDAKYITDILVGADEDGQGQLNEMKLSAIKEVGNIMVCSYLNSLSDLTGLKIEVSIPGLAIDMVGALMDVPIIEFGSACDELMFIEGKFIGAENDMDSNIIMFTEIGTLSVIIERLGLKI